MDRFQLFETLYRGEVAGESRLARRIRWAESLLARGVDTLNLRILAGLSELDGSSEADEYFRSTLRDLGEDPPREIERRLAMARIVAADVLAGAVAPSDGTRRIHELAVGPLNHPRVLQGWCDLDGGFVTMTDARVRRLDGPELDAEILRHARAFLDVDPEEQLATLSAQVAAGPAHALEGAGRPSDRHVEPASGG